MARFRIQSWPFGELARQYYPKLAPYSAARLFRRELRETRGLWRHLQETGYKAGTKVFTRSQVKAIVRYLGEP